MLKNHIYWQLIICSATAVLEFIFSYPHSRTVVTRIVDDRRMACVRIKPVIMSTENNAPERLPSRFSSEIPLLMAL